MRQLQPGCGSWPISSHGTTRSSSCGREPRFSVTVPDEVTLKVEIEIGEKNEIEIELTW